MEEEGYLRTRKLDDITCGEGGLLEMVVDSWRKRRYVLGGGHVKLWHEVELWWRRRQTAGGRFVLEEAALGGGDWLLRESWLMDDEEGGIFCKQFFY